MEASKTRRHRRRRCGNCGELFYADLRVGNRQRYCSCVECQLARKSDYQRQYRKKHPAEDRARRLREALASVKEGGSRAPPRPQEPMARVPWDEIGSEFGEENAVMLACVLGLVVRWLIGSDSGGQDRVSSSR